MFPADVKTALDGMPIAIQIGVSLAALVFALCCMATVVVVARKKEPAVSKDLAIPSYSILSMDPVREGVSALRDLTRKQDEFIENQHRMIQQHDRNAALLERLIDVLREDASDRRARDRWPGPSR